MKEMKDVFEELEAEVAQNVLDRKHDEIERKNLLIVNDNLIAECLYKEVFYVAMNSELNVARFTEMHVANTIVEARCLEHETELSTLRDKSHNDNHNELVNRFSNLENMRLALVRKTLTHEIKNAPVLLIKKKQVTFVEQYDTLNSNTYKHVAKLNTQKTNVPVSPSTGVNHCTDASGSQPKKNRISPAKGVNEMNVEEHPRTNKFQLRTSNRVDSSSRPKRTVVQIVLWYLDSGCSKHMTGDRSRLMNFVKKFIEIVRFRNDHFGAIMGYEDYVIGDSVIFRVYYVEGVGHNLFFVRQFCDSDLEVAFRKHSCYVRDTDGVELIKGSRGSNLYTISVEDMIKSSLICLFSKASKNKSWLWHRRLNHLNFGTINDLARKDLVREAVATACYTKNRSLIHTRHNKTPYELDRSYFSDAWTDKFRVVPNPVPAALYVPPTNKDLEILFQPMFDEYLEPHHVERPVSPALAVQVPVNLAGTPSSTTIYQDAPSPSIPPSSLALQSPSLHQGIAAESTLIEDNLVALVDNNPIIHVFALEPSSDASSSEDTTTLYSTRFSCIVTIAVPLLSATIMSSTPDYQLADIFTKALPREWFEFLLSRLDTMADVNVNAPADQAPTMAPPTHTDDQILPHIRWVPIGKKRILEEFTQSIHTIIEDKKNLAHHTHGKKKATLIVILSVRFTKLIIYYLQSKHKFQPRSDPPLHLPNEEPVLGYIKFSAKGAKREVFGMPIPNKLIATDIQGEQYYKEYLEKVAKHQRYLAGKKGSDPDTPAPKPAKATKKSKPSAPKADLRPPVTKPTSSQQPKPTPVPANSLRSVDESIDEGNPEKEPIFDDEEADIQRAVGESLKSGYDAPQGPLLPVVIREPDSRKYQPLPKVQGKGKEKVNSEMESDKDVPGIDVGVQDEGHARPNPGEHDEGQAGPNPGFTATAYPNVQENLKLTVEEHVILEEPASSIGTLSSLQHLAKDLSFGDLFFNDKPSEAYIEKTTAETEAESMVFVSIQQDTSSIPPMTTPIIDLTPRPDSPNVHRLLQAMITETTTTTTTTITHLPPPQPQQSTTYSMLMKRIGELKQIMMNLIQDNKHLEERLDSHGARLYTLENLGIPHQVSKAMDEIVIDAVDWAIQALLQNLFRDLPEADMKEILHQQLWETNSYKAHEDHMMLYEALEKSMNRDHTDELLKDLAEAHKKKKKRRDSPKTPPGSPPPPLPPAGQSHGSTASSSSKTYASVEYKAWTTTDTRLRPSASSTPEDLHMDYDMAPDAQVHSSDDEDIENAHIPKVNLQQDWWKPLEEDRPVTPKPAWSIPSSNLPVPKNNWASALASTYSLPPEDSLLAQTGDMAMFMNWFYKRQGITELKPQDLEGPAFKLVKVFHLNLIHLEYQIEEFHKLLTDSVDDSIIRHNVSKPLPLGGPPGQVIIQSDFFFNKDLEYLRYGSKGSRPALSI
nr:integrase, catalytic region, zinc finger, CCHC-type, peptidase aspartic, catalytic [Tanacetum cinerariifolium]